MFFKITLPTGSVININPDPKSRRGEVLFVLSNQLEDEEDWFGYFPQGGGVSLDRPAMGVKMLQCFPFYRRCKDRCKSKQCPPAAGPTSPIAETKPRLSSTTSWSSDSDGAGSLSRNSQIYFSSKARLSFRHQMDSNINAVDATY